MLQFIDSRTRSRSRSRSNLDLYLHKFEPGRDDFLDHNKHHLLGSNLDLDLSQKTCIDLDQLLSQSQRSRFRLHLALAFQLLSVDYSIRFTRVHWATNIGNKNIRSGSSGRLLCNSAWDPSF